MIGTLSSGVAKLLPATQRPCRDWRYTVPQWLHREPSTCYAIKFRPRRIHRGHEPGQKRPFYGGRGNYPNLTEGLGQPGLPWHFIRSSSFGQGIQPRQISCPSRQLAGRCGRHTLRRLMAVEIEHPAHYNWFDIECMDVAQHFPFHRGNALKYYLAGRAQAGGR